LSRSFAFLEFSCHADAMLAYKRLQKPDVIFGHAERTAKVAFAEPIREPDPEIMAQVKSVFINGLPLHWDEDHVREHLKSYGEIVKIVLARKMSTSKRKDYGFVDFSTHEAALACVDGVNKSELGDGTSKVYNLLPSLCFLYFKGVILLFPLLSLLCFILKNFQ
jgi:RNA recognition motif-containing protein